MKILCMVIIKLIHFILKSIINQFQKYIYYFIYQNYTISNLDYDLGVLCSDNFSLKDLNDKIQEIACDLSFKSLFGDD